MNQPVSSYVYDKEKWKCNCTQVFRALFTLTRNGNSPHSRQLRTNCGLSTQWNTRLQWKQVKCWHVLQRGRAVEQVLSERDQTQSPHCVILFIWNVPNKQTHGDRKWVSGGCRRLRGGRNSEWLLVWMSFFFGMMKMFWSPDWCGSVGCVLSCKPKDHHFNSRSGHTPGLWARSLFGGTQGAGNQCFFPSLSPSFL